MRDDSTLLTADEYQTLRAKHARFHAYLDAHKLRSYKLDELPPEVQADHVSNEDISRIEVYEFVNDPPHKYFLYVQDDRATTWVGDTLGRATFGHLFKSNMGDARRSITVRAINGHTYAGFYYCGAGDYARVSMVKA